MKKEIFNWKDEFGKGRCCMLLSAWLFKILRDVMIGMLYVAYLSANGFTLTEVSTLSSLLLASSFFSIISPVILERFRKRKLVLATGKLLYYFINIAGLTLVPLMIKDRNAMITVFGVLVFVSGILNCIITGGYYSWHSNFVKGESAALYFSVQQTTSNILGSIILLGLSRIVDAYSGTAEIMRVFMIMRSAALLLGILDVVILSIPKEYEYKKAHEKIELLNLIRIPFSCRKFIATMAIYSVWLFSVGLTDTVGNYHLQSVVGVPVTLMNMYSLLYALALVLLSGAWRKVLRRHSWLTTFGIAGLIHAPSALIMAFVNESNYSWLYMIMILIQAVAGVGLNLADLNMVYVNTPDTDQTYYIGFFTMISSLVPFLGKLCADIVIHSFEGRYVLISGMEFGPVRFLMLAQWIGFVLCSALFILRRDKLRPDRKTI